MFLAGIQYDPVLSIATLVQPSLVQPSLVQPSWISHIRSSSSAGTIVSRTRLTKRGSLTRKNFGLRSSAQPVYRGNNVNFIRWRESRLEGSNTVDNRIFSSAVRRPGRRF
jgi:hypothetical protein